MGFESGKTIQIMMKIVAKYDGALTRTLPLETKASLTHVGLTSIMSFIIRILDFSIEAF